MASLTVIRPGMLTTVQDLGRWGLSDGRAGGGADGRVLTPARQSPGRQPEDAAALEITLIGPELQFDADGGLCRRGRRRSGSRSVMLRCPCTRRSRSRPASGFVSGRARAGTRATLAVRGGFDAARVLAAAPPAWSAAMGPLGGRALKAGDILPLGHAPACRRPRPRGLPLPLPAGGARLRVIPGPHARDVHVAALSRRCTERDSRSRRNRTGWAIGWKVRASNTADRRGHPVRRDADRIAPGPGVRPADPADGRSPDDGRLSEDRHRDHGRPADRRSARAGRLDRIRARARARPRSTPCVTGARRLRGGDDGDLDARLRSARSGPIAFTATRRSRRSRRSRSAAPPTG